MEQINTVIFLTIFTAGTLAGILTNGFIFTLTVHYWIKRRKLNPSENIIMALAFLNEIFSGVHFASIVQFIFFPKTTLATMIVDFLLLYVVFSNPWLGACLCFFFFVKINDFKPGYLAQIKSKIDSMVPWFILGAHLYSMFNCMLLAAMDITFNGINVTMSILTGQGLNMTDGNMLGVNISLVVISINYIIPFLIIMIMASLIIASLYKHTHHMQQNMGQYGTPNLKIHQRAARILTSFLIFYLLLFFFTIGGELFVPASSLYWACTSMTCLCSPMQATILILGNARLKKTCVKIFNRCRKKEFSKEGNQVDTNQTL
ncbi:hypothetical protein GDO86_017774 [Hymenochirus boettgeri]|uniref:Taste receptor type 2 n=1 Tax=Hymenochirus boettgeri TaxID=247094 RepID=A0A8T2ITT4_9PIPI|nr:hypothetical protein GDO86_017774 [Hymenochirus boettgeri]